MSNKLKGGLADNKTVEDIARKHSVFVGTIKKALEKGMKVESEHTTDKELQEEIAKDHLWEDPEYYENLEKMEKKSKEVKKQKETKEQVMADAAGSFEAPINDMPSSNFAILKRDIYKLNEMEGIPGMAYDGPIGTAGPSSPMDKTKKKRKDPLELDEKGETASITAASTPDMVSTKKGFPRFGGPDAKFVEIDSKCKTFPYCDQGDSGKKFKYISEIHGMKEAIESAAKKYGFSVKQIEEMILKEARNISEAYELPTGIDITPALSWGKKSEEKFSYHLITIDPKTKEPIPLNFTTKDEIEFNKLKVMLHGNGTIFEEDKTPIKDEGGTSDINSPSEDSIYGSDDDPDFDVNDDIFAKYKK